MSHKFGKKPGIWKLNNDTKHTWLFPELCESSKASYVYGQGSNSLTIDEIPEQTNILLFET